MEESQLIQAMIFDLDGTLVQTEKLKAQSYASAVIDLCPHEVESTQVVEVFKEVVGRSRKEVAETLIDRFELLEKAEQRMSEYGVQTPWQAFIQIRLQYYQELLADPQILRRNRWPHNLRVLDLARSRGCKTGLATMSHCKQVNRVLEVLDLTEAFDFIASRDDVEQGKPDPEIYSLVASVLQVSTDRCLVIEDSPSGVQAALTAGMWCIAVSTPFTWKSLNESGLLDPRWIVNDPKQVIQVVEAMLDEREKS